MTEGVKEQDTAPPENNAQPQGLSDKELNFRRLEAAKEAEKEARIRAEMQNEMLRKEMDSIKQMLQPKETDPLDEVEDYVDPARLKASLSKRDAYLKKEAEEIARKTYQEQKKKDLQENYLSRLKSEHRDYDDVMNETNIANLEKIDPDFVRTVLRIDDEYVRRSDTYHKIKNLKKEVVEEKPSIKEKVAENATNPYFIPATSGTPSAVDYDLRSPSARKEAYEKLKAAQRRPIGNGLAPRQ